MLACHGPVQSRAAADRTARWWSLAVASVPAAAVRSRRYQTPESGMEKHLPVLFLPYHVVLAVKTLRTDVLGESLTRVLSAALRRALEELQASPPA